MKKVGSKQKKLIEPDTSDHRTYAELQNDFGKANSKGCLLVTIPIVIGIIYFAYVIIKAIIR